MDSHLKTLIGHLTSPGTMMAAEQRFLDAGMDAVPVLETIFTGEARNEFGISFRQLGLPLQGALEIACRLGPVAKPLEPYLRQEVRHGIYWAAVSALGQIPPLEEESIRALADALNAEFNFASTAAKTLIQLAYTEHPAVLHQVSTSPSAAKVWETVLGWQSTD